MLYPFYVIAVRLHYREAEGAHWGVEVWKESGC